MAVVAFPKKPVRTILSAATLRALLEDTKELLQLLRYADEESAQDALTQVEAIDQILAT